MIIKNNKEGTNDHTDSNFYLCNTGNYRKEPKYIQRRTSNKYQMFTKVVHFNTCLASPFSAFALSL